MSQHDQTLRELSVDVIYRFTIHVNFEFCEWHFSLYFVFWVKNKLIFAWFYMKSQNLLQSGTIEISQSRTEVKCDSVKYRKIAFER